MFHTVYSPVKLWCHYSYFVWIF